MIDNKLTATVSVLAALTLWFYLSASIAAQGAFLGTPGAPPIMLGLAVAIPVITMIILYSRKQWLWSFANSLDLRLLVLMHAGRFLALDFLVNYHYGNLPAAFALPAGIGDMLTAAFAITLASSLNTPSLQIYKWFIRWNILGILDLFVALSAGILYSGTFASLVAGRTTTRIMTELPHSLVPTFFVPLYIALHLLMLSRAREVYAPNVAPA